MTVELQTKATENSSYVVTVSFEDEDGDAVIPNEITWTLKDEDTGLVVNSRTAVSIATPAASNDILLKGDDLEPLTLTSKKLIMTVNATYDSALGTDIPLVGECFIVVETLEP
jgi:hypothetical protein